LRHDVLMNFDGRIDASARLELLRDVDCKA
jgi:hypothetical protein